MTRSLPPQACRYRRVRRRKPAHRQNPWLQTKYTAPSCSPACLPPPLQICPAAAARAPHSHAAISDDPLVGCVFGNSTILVAILQHLAAENLPALMRVNRFFAGLPPGTIIHRDVPWVYPMQRRLAWCLRFTSLDHATANGVVRMGCKTSVPRICREIVTSRSFPAAAAPAATVGVVRQAISNGRLDWIVYACERLGAIPVFAQYHTEFIHNSSRYLDLDPRVNVVRYPLHGDDAGGGNRDLLDHVEVTVIPVMPASLVGVVCGFRLAVASHIRHTPQNTAFLRGLRELTFRYPELGGLGFLNVEILKDLVSLSLGGIVSAAPLNELARWGVTRADLWAAGLPRVALCADVLPITRILCQEPWALTRQEVLDVLTNNRFGEDIGQFVFEQFGIEVVGDEFELQMMY